MVRKSKLIAEPECLRVVPENHTHQIKLTSDFGSCMGILLVGLILLLNAATILSLVNIPSSQFDWRVMFGILQGAFGVLVVIFGLLGLAATNWLAVNGE